MAFASHLGSWLLGTVKNTTGTTAGTIRNMGYTTVAQNKAVAYNDTAATQAAVVPAGSIIQELALYQSGATFTGTSGVITVYLNGTAIAASSAITGGTAGIITFAPSSQAQTALWANVGSTDAIITYTMASSGSLSAGSGQLFVEYGVRASDGTFAPTSSNA